MSRHCEWNLHKSCVTLYFLIETTEEINWSSDPIAIIYETSVIFLCLRNIRVLP